MLGFTKSPEVSVGLLFFVERRTLETRTNCQTNKELGRWTLGNESELRMCESRTKLRTGLLSEGTLDELYELDFSERFLEFLNKYLLFDITKNQNKHKDITKQAKR
ncbi:unnamed protein product [Rhizophagus irregularis]|nr:unnamed protein product [Rhizophagus irregularis]